MKKKIYKWIFRLIHKRRIYWDMETSSLSPSGQHYIFGCDPAVAGGDITRICKIENGKIIEII
jgi:hypothetical protein